MHARRTLVSLVLLSWLVPSSPALAKLAVIAVDQDPKTAEVFARPGRIYMMKFDCNITHIGNPHHPYFEIPDPNPANEARVEIATYAHNASAEVVFRCEEYTLNLTIRTSRDAQKVSQAALIVRVRNPQQLAALIAERDAAIAQRDAATAQLTLTAAELTTEQTRVRELEQKVQELTPPDNQIRATAEKALLREVDVSATVRALAQSTSCDTPGIVICGKRWAELNQHGILHFTVANNTSADFEFSRVQAFRHDTPGNIAGSIRIGGEEPVDPDKVLGRVPARTRLPVAVVVRDHKQMGNQLRLELSGLDTMTAIRIIELDSPEPRDPPEPRQGEGRITIRVTPSIGGVWLANPVNDKELGAARLVGVGLRTSYAFMTALSVEAELAGIQSNDASFRDVLFEGANGDVLRSTKGARLLVSGALRVGKKIQPFLRAGFGAQVVDHDVRFVTGQTTTTGPGDGVALDGLVVGAIGLDIHFGEHWTAGAGLSLMKASGTKTAAFSTAAEAGIHVGYGWGGYVRD